MTIRTAKTEDATALADLRWRFRSEGGELPALQREAFNKVYVEFFEAGLQDGLRTHWIAEEDGSVVGHVVLQRIDLVPRPCKPRDRIGLVTDNYVCPEHRSRGVGSRLLAALREAAAAEDLELLIVWPSERAVPFYERAGFAGGTEVLQLQLRPSYDPAWGTGSAVDPG